MLQPHGGYGLGMAKSKKPKKISNPVYEAELLRMQTELVTLQE